MKIKVIFCDPWAFPKALEDWIIKKEKELEEYEKELDAEDDGLEYFVTLDVKATRHDGNTHYIEYEEIVDSEGAYDEDDDDLDEFTEL
jgi:hypothetical protein